MTFLDRLEKGILDLAVLLEPIDSREVETVLLPREELDGESSFQRIIYREKGRTRLPKVSKAAAVMVFESVR